MSNSRDPAAHYTKVGADIENKRIVEILENHRISIIDISSDNWIGLWHDAIAKVKAGAEISQGRINENDFHYSEGFESGVQAERERIIEALTAKAATRTILETLEQPFYIYDLIRTIMEGQDD